jgi:DNA-binding transcriptional LysR family regulator
MDATGYGELRTFLTVCEERGFRRSAVRLGTSPSAVSRAVRALEQRLGIRLLNRTTRSVAPTEAGSALMARVTPMIAEMEAALRDVGSLRTSPRGTVRVNLPQAAATIAVLPKLPGFTAAFPDIRVDLVVDNNITDVVGRGFDAGVRIGSQVGADMVAVRLTPDFRMAVVASPRYLEAHGHPASPADLRRHRCLTYRWDETGVLFPWRFHSPAGREVVQVDSVLTANDTDLLLSAALRGTGIALVVETVAAPHICNGSLVRLLDDWCGPVPGFHLYYSSRLHMAATLRAFIDWMKLSEPGSFDASVAIIEPL